MQLCSSKSLVIAYALLLLTINTVHSNENSAMLDQAHQLLTKGKMEQAYSIANSIRLKSVYENDHRSLARALYLMGSAYQSLSDHKKSIHYLNQSLSVYQQTNDLDGQAMVLDNIASLFLDMNDFQSMLEYSNQAIDLADKVSEKTRSKIYANHAYKLFKVNDVETSTEFFNKAHKILVATNNEYYLIYFHLMKADVHRELLEIEKSINHLEQAKTIANNLNKNELASIAELGVAKTLMANEEYQDAIEILLSLENTLKLSHTKGNLNELYQFLYTCYKHQKKYDKALTYYEKATQLSNSIKAENNNQFSKLLMTEYRFNESKESLNQLKHTMEKELAEVHLKNKQLSIYLYIALAALTLTLFALWRRR
ncbi:tetratricopeptide repeat protein [Pleionea mediterranea]|uniref:Tetratricopeptide repeat protein n=1 Tax=Pleionea mediterranea TaxID=523701 RepID=A0A316FXQ4_9GAMM|nr:tetratricopeptide repeat protein [Pleionea mediterranea]PWK53369.1 tetratricopeptide repeat protein [Pleionea mediterranea]